MTEVRVLNGRAPADREEWLSAWREWPEREAMAHPDYVRLFARDVDQPHCAIVRAAGSGVLYPFILRPLAAEPWAADEPGHDITGAYGYGGAQGWGNAEPLWADFWKSFETWASSARVVTSFARLSLFEAPANAFAGTTRVERDNVVRTLDLDEEALSRDYEHKVRKNVKRARASGLTVEVDETGARLAEFLAVYESTMDRRQAGDAYYFGEPFFRAIVEDLKGSFAFFHVLEGAKVVSTELVLVSATRLYSYLGGTLSEAFHLRPNDLLKHEVALWGRAHGKQAYVLGGGYQPDDGIYRYKKSFAPKGDRPFSVGTRIHDEARFGQLLGARRAWEAARGVEWEPRSGYFPEYRS